MLKNYLGILGFPELLTTIPVGGPGGPLAGPFCANLPAVGVTQIVRSLQPLPGLPFTEILVAPVLMADGYYVQKRIG